MPVTNTITKSKTIKSVRQFTFKDNSNFWWWIVHQYVDVLNVSQESIVSDLDC